MNSDYGKLIKYYVRYSEYNELMTYDNLWSRLAALYLIVVRLQTL